jgi:hydroxyacylglutathione hydrolase
LTFALAVEPKNSELVHYYNQVIERRENNLSTIPTSILLEKKINPFLRCKQPEIVNSAANFGGNTPEDELETFTMIRQWKNQF